MQNTEKKPFEKRNGNRNHDKKSFNKEIDPITSKLVDVNRITKVVKGGRNMRFSALVVAGDKAGKVGTDDVMTQKKMQKRHPMIAVPLEGTTIPHEVIGKFGTSMVKLLPAKEGTGVIAGGSVRPVVELCGIKDITAKTYGSRNKINCVKATLDGLMQLRSKEEIAALRGKSVEEIL